MSFPILFSHGPLEIPPLELTTRETGAVLEFQGLVRELEHGEALAGLFYEAHEPMARKRLDAHVAELRACHPVTALVFIHRLGWVPVGAAAVFIRVLSTHREEGLLFLSSLVIRLKQDVPIWKMVKRPITQS